jgi:N-acetylmuramoyl-L-alanine amidase
MRQMLNFFLETWYNVKAEFKEKEKILLIKRLLLIPFLAILCVCPLWQSQAADKASITNVRIVTRNDADVPFVRSVVDLTTPVKPKLIIDDSGQYITVTLPYTKIDSNLKKQYNGNKNIMKSMSLAQHSNATDVNIRVPRPVTAADVKVFTLTADALNKKPNRVVIDINDKSGSVKKWIRWRVNDTSKDRGSVDFTKQQARKQYPVYTGKPSFSLTQGLQNKVICIDPGHGGSDSGAVGKISQEKNITLAIAKELKDLLEKGGAKVVMTRTTDIDVYAPNDGAVEELQARCDIANDTRADAFVCIHIDSYATADASGVTAYYNGKTPYDFNLAKYIHAQNIQATTFPDRGVKTANFYVLLHTNMPATLLELGFISNPQEEKTLNTDSQVEQFASSIYNGLADYFNAGGK